VGALAAADVPAAADDALADADVPAAADDALADADDALAVADATSGAVVVDDGAAPAAAVDGIGARTRARTQRTIANRYLGVFSMGILTLVLRSTTWF